MLVALVLNMAGSVNNLTLLLWSAGKEADFNVCRVVGKIA